MSPVPRRRRESDDEWHKNASHRRVVGSHAEAEFDYTWLCHCGGEFAKNDVEIIWYPDRICKKCGQLVDVKSPPQAAKYGKMLISQEPFDNYGDDLILVWRKNIDANGSVIPIRWLGIYRSDAKASGPHKSTHEENATPFYKVDVRNFVPLEELGFVAR